MKRAFALAVILLTFATMGAAQSYYLNVWVDRGCGGNYKVGDKILVYYDTNYNWGFEVTIWERRPNGTRFRVLGNAGKMTCAPCTFGYVIKEELIGKRTIEVEIKARPPYVLELKNVCDFNVVESLPTSGTLLVSAKDQNGAAIAGATVLLDGADKGRTDGMGLLTLEGVQIGNHTLEVVFAGGRETRSVYVAAGTQSADFLFSVAGQQGGQVLLTVRDSTGSPVSGAEVLVDGVGVGLTDLSGSLAIPLSSGMHTLLVRKSGIEKSATITIQEGQAATSEIVLGGGRVTFVVKDTKGMPLASTQIVVDNALLGLTDTAGTLEADVSPGQHVVMATKEGYGTMTITPTIEAGETIDILMSATTSYYTYGGILAAIIFLILVIALLFMRKRQPMASVTPVFAPPPDEEKKKKGKDSKGDKKPDLVEPVPAYAEPAQTGRARYCKICHGALDKEQNPYVCECTQVYHHVCAERQKEMGKPCPACGRPMAV